MFYIIDTAKPEATPFGPWATRATARKHLAALTERMESRNIDSTTVKIVSK